MDFPSTAAAEAKQFYSLYMQSNAWLGFDSEFLDSDYNN